MIMNPSTIHEVVIDGHSLTIESFMAVARFGAKVSVSPEAIANMQKSRDLAEKIAAEKRVAYGITTGFGDFAKVAVPEEMSNTLSTNLILSHCTATGEPYSEEVVRGMLLLRANALCVGVSGVRPVLVTMMAEMLNKGVVPVVPQKGSLRATLPRWRTCRCRCWARAAPTIRASRWTAARRWPKPASRRWTPWSARRAWD